jgi:hypothetical protein
LEETIARLLQVFVALAGAYLLALWFALAIWTYRDITARTTNAVVQVLSTLLAVLFFAPGAIIYLILRPRETLDEAFQRSIEEEYLVQDLEEYPLCPSCRRAVRDDFVYCPHCHVELRGACENCRRLIDLRWEICGRFAPTAAPTSSRRARPRNCWLIRHRVSVRQPTADRWPSGPNRRWIGPRSGRTGKPTMIRSRSSRRCQACRMMPSSRMAPTMTRWTA